jgi:HK97 family phage prohead protease
MNKTRGHLRGEVRAVAEDGTIEVLAVVWGVVDDYGTRFVKGAFTESIEARLPTIAWAHDWSEPVGRAVSYRETDEGLFITARLDIGQGIARADQAYAQLKSGTLDDVSIGFWRLADRTGDDGVTEITKGDLDEVSVVLRGAVPGAKVMAVRSARTGEMVPVDSVVAIAEKVAAGEISQAAADEALRLLSSPGTTIPPPAADDVDLALAAADQALVAVADRSR